MPHSHDRKLDAPIHRCRQLGFVVQNDGGLLFGLALTVFTCSGVVPVLRRRGIPVPGSLFVPLHELSCEAKGGQH